MYAGKIKNVMIKTIKRIELNKVLYKQI